MKKRLLLVLAICTTGFANAQSEFWGVTQQSGDNNLGTIYKTDSIGENHTVVYSFSDGSKPSGSLVEASNGLLYGMTAFGGSTDMGIVFSMDPVTETFTKISDLSASTGGRPRGEFMEATDGFLYGTTYEGGAGSGTLISLDPATNTVTTEFIFNTGAGGITDGPAEPFAGTLVEAVIGELYGVTRKGGQYGFGTIYKFEIATGSVTKLFDFSSASNGGEPFNTMVHASNGLLYGMTFKGGPTDKGAIFAYNPVVDTFAVQHYFSSAQGIGTNPQGALLESNDGNLYGMTSTSGQLFSFDVNTTDVTGLQSVGDVRGTLIEANDKLYGVRYTGNLFEYDPLTDAYGVQSNVGNYGLYGHLIEVGGTSSIGLIETNETMIKVYPNPATDVINIDGAVSNVRVFDVYGQLLKAASTNQLVISDLPSGIYIVTISNEDGFASTRIVKE